MSLLGLERFQWLLLMGKRLPDAMPFMFENESPRYYARNHTHVFNLFLNTIMGGNMVQNVADANLDAMVRQMLDDGLTGQG